MSITIASVRLVQARMLSHHLSRDRVDAFEQRRIGLERLEGD
ncbi:MAG: hypothetical protein R3B70_43740 [Polyangiaceae bacterium]